MEMIINNYKIGISKHLDMKYFDFGDISDLNQLD